MSAAVPRSSDPRCTVLYPVNELIIGGSEQQLLELARGLDKERFRVIVAPLYPDGALTDEFRATPGVEIVELRRAGKCDPSPLARIGRLLRRERVEIVQPFLSPSTVFGLVPALVGRTPVTVLTERCGVRRFRSRGSRLYSRLEAALSHLVDAVVPNSEAGRELALQRGIPASKIHVIHNGINLDRLRPDPERLRAARARLGVPSGGAVVGILATLKPAKDQATFLRAAARIAAVHPEVRFAVVGDGPLRAELEQLAAQLDLIERVTFFGFQRDVASHLVACDVLVSASRDNEGHSNSILEAMALGVPVVATDIGGNRELIEPETTGLLVAVGDSAGLARSVERLLADRALAGRLADRAGELVRSEFSLPRMVAEYEALYDRLLTSKGLAPAGRRTREPLGALGQG